MFLNVFNWNFVLFASYGSSAKFPVWSLCYQTVRLKALAWTGSTVGVYDRFRSGIQTK